MPDEDPKVTVLMAAFNEEGTVENAIASIRNQDYTDWEFVIVDDGSTDGTGSILSEYERGDERIRVLENEDNLGLPGSLNRGISAARGEYIARMDADDRSRQDRLSRQVDVLDTIEDVCVVGCWYDFVGRNEEKITTFEIPQSCSFTVVELVNNGPKIAHGSVMMRKECLEAVGRYRDTFSLAQDYDLWLRMAEEFGPEFVHIVPDVLYERKMSVDQLEKRPTQRVYSNAAKEGARRRANGLPERLDDVSERANEVTDFEYTGRERESMYQYLAGVKLLQQGHVSEARRRFVSAIRVYPLNLRPWYKFVLSISSSRVETIVRRLRDQYVTGNQVYDDQTLMGTSNRDSH